MSFRRKLAWLHKNINDFATRATIRLRKSELAFSEGNINAALKETLEQEIKPFVRQALAARYGQSGLAVKSGKLLAMVKGSTVHLGRMGQIVIGFPYIGSMSGKRKGGNVYAQGASLQHGAVRTGRGVTRIQIGNAAKKTLKKYRLTGKGLSKRARKSLDEGVRQYHDGRMIERGAVNFAKVTVIPPKPFYGPIDDLVPQISTMLAEGISRRLSAKVR